jgi:hypothetical protein
MTEHLAGTPVIGAKEISDAIVGKSRPHSDPLRAHLVPDQALREVEPTEVTGITVF